jgi:hypothetical protein
MYQSSSSSSGGICEHSTQETTSAREELGENSAMEEIRWRRIRRRREELGESSAMEEMARAEQLKVEISEEISKRAVEGWHQEPAQRPPVQHVLDELDACDAPPLTAPPFPGGRHLKGSNFKREYEGCSPPEHQHEVLKAVTEIVFGYFDLHKITDGARDDFVSRLFAEWGKAKEAKDVLNIPVKISCLLVWTSQEKLDGRIEFCSIFCEVLREDYAVSAEQAAVLARGINGNLCVPESARGSSSFHSALMQQSFPKGPSDTGSKDRPRWRCAGEAVDSASSIARSSPQIRSTGRPCFSRYRSRKRRRKNSLVSHALLGFLARKMRSFCGRSSSCHHVNLVQDKDTHVEGECEFLFVPYSVFTVESVTWSATPQDHTTPHRVTLAKHAQRMSRLRLGADVALWWAWSQRTEL